MAVKDEEEEVQPRSVVRKKERASEMGIVLLSGERTTDDRDGRTEERGTVKREEEGGAKRWTDCLTDWISGWHSSPSLRP